MDAARQSKASGMETVCGIAHSLTGKRWIWRGGNMALTDGGVDVSSDGGSNALGDDLVTQLLLARGVDRADLARHRQPTLKAFLPDPSIFCDMDAAADRLAQAVLSREQVTIYGDYDVDGATSAALLVRLLRQFGLSPEAYIPDRLMEGYGPSGEALLKIGAAGSSLIVTVDCGAMAFDALAAARSAGIDVIVVDHHKCAPTLPEAFALVNPNRLDESDEAASYGYLAAVGVAFLLAVALVRRLRALSWFNGRAEPDLLALLDLVALGTVADVASLKGLNRAFVSQGLKVMARRQNTGMSALIDASRLNRAPLCSDLGFALGPRINAGGRVGESRLGVRLLTTNDADEARAIAVQLNTLNEERRAIEAAVQQEAEAQISTQHNRSVIVLAGEGWHPGVIGIVAGRIKEKTGKPSIVIALDGAEGKGSGRSIAGVDLGAAIIAAGAAGLLEKGGGHAMAAGLTVAADRLAGFADWIDDRLAPAVSIADTGQSALVDLMIAPRGLNPALIEQIEAGGPYGMGWPAPRLVVGPVRIVKADVVGADHLRLIVAGDDGQSFKAMAFRSAEAAWAQALMRAEPHQKLWLCGRAKLDDWGSRPAVELHIDDAAFVR